MMFDLNICNKNSLTGNKFMKVGVCWEICQKWVFLERFVKTNRMLALPSPHKLLHSTRWEILKCWIQHKASGIRMTDVLHMFVNFIFSNFIYCTSSAKDLCFVFGLCVSVCVFCHFVFPFFLVGANWGRW